MNWEKADAADERWSDSLKKAVEQTRGSLAQALATTLQVTKDHKEQLLVKQGRSDSHKARVTDITGQVTKVEEVFRISFSKRRWPWWK